LWLSDLRFSAEKHAGGTVLSRRFEDFLNHCTYVRGLSPKTVQTYRQAFKTLPADANLSREILSSWITNLRARGVSPAGVNCYVRSVNSYLTWAHEEGLIAERLHCKQLRAPKRIPVLLTADDVKRIVAYRPATMTERRSKVLCLLLLDCGLRISEALSLQRARVDFDHMVLVVQGKGAKQRPVPFSRELRQILFPWVQKTKGALVFETRNSRPLAARNAYRDLAALCEAAGIAAHVHPHLMRHQFASTYVRKGGDLFRLSKLLGHEAVTTTQKYVRGLGAELLLEDAVRLSPLTK
jgi:site-specific recombinase XerD